ncbi:hypothetical protein HKCCD6035_07330 [Rhodobacterales bacterium HKCCD6035]|nr:hypothetical protein [Rhodobacterales bacterium HKCCD6035]
MADDLKNRPIIIKRKKVVGGDGHHGGAWKVAYADFVTAMMAFFMLMWLLNATTEQQRKGIADYFSPNVPIARISGGGESAFGGESPFSELSVAQNDRAARMELVVMNSGGQVVQTQAIDPAGGRLRWTGETEAGAALPNGTYRFETRAYIEGKEVPKTEPVRVFTRIHEARMEGDQLRLVMAGGVEIAADQVEVLCMP